MLTFRNWFNKKFTKDGSNFISGKLAEEGYAFYLEQQLGRKPTIAEVKKFGKIASFIID